MAKMPASDNKWVACNGQQFRKLVGAGFAWLEKNHAHVNALNVFPVPDGDTGTNMLLTMRSAYKQVANSDENNVGKMAQQVSRGALMGARGNSGVILSQIWKGLAKGFDNKETFNGDDLAKSLLIASDTAYGGVMKPVEGTLLTVIREASEEAKDAATKSEDLRFVLGRTLERARQALERTPDQLPVLKQAGVVDSGGQGLVYILEGMIRYVDGLPVGDVSNNGTTAATAHQAPAQAFAVPEGGHIENPYDVQFLIFGENLDVLKIRETIDAMGDSTVVVGDETTVKVHVHVEDPGVPISYGVSLGQITDVVVENMQEQMEEIVGGGMAAPPIENPINMPTIEPGQIGVIAVVPGKGLAKIFTDLGVAYIVDGGQTNNPSTEEIFQAIQDVATDKIIILPNNKNIFMAAEAARDLSPKNVVVLPTRTVPEGVGALFTYQRDGDFDSVVSAMKNAVAGVATGQITTATRTVSLNGVDVKEGNIIGLADGEICAAGDSWSAVLPETLVKMEAEEREIITIYYGADVTEADAESLGGEIEALYPDVEVEIVPGGQAHYYFILGAE